MATNPPRKPPDHDTAVVSTAEFNHVSSSSSSSLLLKQRRSTCSCSNIAIMQLFHEMKQKFPTVPDHVVSDLVTANCHNRPACIDSLEKAVLGTPATAQAYPSQVIHNTSLKRRINERKLRSMEHSFSGGSSGSSSRESSVDKTSSGGCGSRFHHNNNATTSPAAEAPRDGNGNVNNVDNQPAPTMTTPSPTFDNANTNNNSPPNRPNTLAFSGPRPTRVAPPIPPISSTITASPELGETVNVQLNVTVSPVASRSPLGQRHTSVLQLQPESPYSRELAQASTVFNATAAPAPGANSRSSTSVNLTLRQPSEGPQSPIHIHASPLKYTAKGFNAQSGIQSKLEITFRDGFGSISAMRTHVPGYEQQQQPAVVAAAADNHLYQEQQMAVNAAQLENDGLERAQRYENYLTEVAITHQLDQKNRLSEEVDRYRQQLESICREIRILQHPLSRSDADQLAREVQLLEEEVDHMQKEVDQQQAQLSIEGSPSAPAGGPYVNRPPRPPRPPPPKFSSSQQQLPAATTAEGRYAGGRSISAPAVPQPAAVAAAAAAGEQWTCSLCTFQNHELMTRCEVCSLPKMPGRLSSQSSLPVGGGPSSAASPSSSSSVVGAAPPASTSLLVAASAPVATAVVLQTSAAAAGSPSSSAASSAASSTASTPQTQPAPPPIQNAQFQKSSIEC